MKLRYIRLKGFKTFGDTSKLSLSDGITAIVGPNGSGKSNLADAVAWVLGEQAPSSLRVRRNRDLLHQPDRDSPASGLAEVEISIEDKGNLLGLEGQAYDVNRSSYPDGESEFRLNGHRTSLHQIREAFAPVGLARRSFCLIRQGHCEQFLTVSSAQRLNIVEEAAGALGIIQKKHAAERRLFRIGAQLAPVRQEERDLQNSLSLLESQARRFEERRRLVEELSAAAAVTYSSAIDEAEEAGLEAEARLSRLLETLQTSEETFISSRNAAGALSDRLKLHSQEIETVRDRLAQAEKSYLESLTRSQVLEERERNQSRLYAKTEEDNRLQVRTLQQAETELATLRRSRADLEDSMWELDQQQTSLELKAKEHFHEVKTLRAAVERAEEEFALNKEAANSGEEELSRLNWQAQQEESLKLRRATELNLAIQNLEAVRIELDRSKSEFAGFEQLKKELVQKLTERRAATAEAWENLRDREGQLRALEGQRDSLQARIHYLREILRQNDAAVDGLGIGEECLGQLGTLISVNAEHQLALASLLGDWQRCFVFRTWAEALPIWNAARARRVETDLRLAVLEAIPALDEDRFGKASSATAAMAAEAEPEILRLLAHLLDGAVLLSGPKGRSGNSLDSLPEGVPRAANSDGDVVFEPGLLFIRGDAQKDEGLLAAFGEFNAAERDLSSLTMRLSVARASQAEAASRVELAKTAEQEIETRIAEAERAGGSARRDAREFEDRVDVLMKTVAELEKAGKRQEEDAARKAERAGELRESILRAAEGGRASGRAKEKAAGRLRALEDRADYSALESVRKRSLETGQRLEKLRVRENFGAERSSALSESLKRGQSELLELQEDRARLQESRRENSELLSVAEERVRSYREDLAPLVQERGRLENENAVQTREFAEQSALFRKLEARRLELELKLTELRERRNRLWSRLQQDLELIMERQVSDAQAAAFLTKARMNATSESTAGRSPIDDEDMNRLRRGIRRCGHADPDHYSRYTETRARLHLVKEQTADLDATEAELRTLAARLNSQLEGMTREAFAAVNRKFGDYFARFFRGGKGWLAMSQSEENEGAGVDLHVQLPGRGRQSLAGLSGGERALAAVAFLFALLSYNRPPFCILDEIDAALDESNVGRVGSALRELCVHTQFILITHNQLMLEYADSIFGVTRSPTGSSQLLSMELNQDRTT